MGLYNFMFRLIWLFQVHDVGLRTQYGVAQNERVTGTLVILSSKLLQESDLWSEFCMWVGCHEPFINNNREDEYIIHYVYVCMYMYI